MAIWGATGLQLQAGTPVGVTLDGGTAGTTALNQFTSNGVIYPKAGVDFGNVIAPNGNAWDTSAHLTLWHGGYGLSITGGRMNVVGSSVVLVAGTIDAFAASSTNLTAFLPLYLGHDPPTATNEATTKQYVDGVITRAGGPFLPLVGGSLSGQLNIAMVQPVLALIKSNGLSGTGNCILGLTNGSWRWQFQIGNGDGESGGNAGSNLAFYRYDDNGNYLGMPFMIRRSDGSANFAQKVFLSQNPTTALEAVPKQYADLFLPLTGGIDHRPIIRAKRRWHLLRRQQRLQVHLDRLYARPVRRQQSPGNDRAAGVGPVALLHGRHD